MADNLPGKDIDFRANVISVTVRIFAGNDFFVFVKNPLAYIFQFVNGDYIVVIAHHTVFGFRNSPVCDIAIVEVFDRYIVVHRSTVVSDGIC